MSAMPPIPLPCLCMVTDRTRTASGDLVETVSAAVEAGVCMVQLREKDMTAGQLLQIARKLRAVTEGNSLLIVNDRLDVALLSGADGVQLGEEAMGVAEARKLIGPNLLIGSSVHSVEGAVAAESNGADFLVLGAIFETTTHPGVETGGLALVEAVTRRVRLPVLGIGGITPANVRSVIDTGAAGAAVITAISMSPDPRAAVRDLMLPMSCAFKTHSQGRRFGRPH